MGFLIPSKLKLVKKDLPGPVQDQIEKRLLERWIEEEKRKSDLPACYTAINARLLEDQSLIGKLSSNFDSIVMVYKSMTEVKKIRLKKVDDRPREERRSVINGRSKKSAYRQKQFLHKSEQFDVMHTLTVCDDVLVNKTWEERYQYCNDSMKRYKEDVRRRRIKAEPTKEDLKEILKKIVNGQEILVASMVWVKEPIDRKSEELKGEIIPHYHKLYQFPKCFYDLDPLDRAFLIYNEIKVRSRIWVKATRTKNEKAFSVATKNPDKERKIKGAFQILNTREDQIGVIKYITQYLSKEQEKEIEGKWIGRCWGYDRSWRLEVPLYVLIKSPEHNIQKRLICKRLEIEEKEVRKKRKEKGLKTFKPGKSYSSKVRKTKASYKVFQPSSFIQKTFISAFDPPF